MPPAMLSVRYLDPTTRTFDESVLGWLLKELPDASTFRFATGYFESSVLDWLEDPLEALLQRGGSVQALIGSNGGQTGRADLERLLEVLTAGNGGTLHVEYAEGGIFHPKVFVVETPTRTAAVIGSANLTANGSLVNVEAGVVLETDKPGPPPESPIDAVIASVDPAPRPDVFSIADVGDLDELEKLGIIGRVAKTAPAAITQTHADRQRERRRRAGVRTRPGVTGIPARTRRRVAGTTSTSVTILAPPVPAPTGDFFGLRFAPNDLKTTGTREFSVSKSMRDWAETVLGRPLVAGEGTLFSVVIEGRLAASPMSIASTVEPVRLWAAGGSGGTHPDVRLVLGNKLRTELEGEAIRLTGLAIPDGAIGVFQLPDDPSTDPARLTVFLPTDPAYSSVESLLARTGSERKLHFRVTSLPQLPAWP
jgi:HKD family nuclease